MKVLVLGVTGMLGSAAFRTLSGHPGLEVVGSARAARLPADLAAARRENRIIAVDVMAAEALAAAIIETRPDVVVNCVGVVKQLASAEDPLTVLPINSILPHRLARYCEAAGARFIHISTDCVFSGARGLYRESDLPDATDLYGRSKLLGEVTGPGAVTLRTSIIGHELASQHSLLEWFLNCKGTVKGFSRAIFSGLTTVEFARILSEIVLSRPTLQGLYHVAGDPIDKHRLLGIVREIYGVGPEIQKDEDFVIDRSLDSSRFNAAMGYTPPSWPSMIAAMKADHETRLSDDVSAGENTRYGSSQR